MRLPDIWPYDRFFRLLYPDVPVYHAVVATPVNHPADPQPQVPCIRTTIWYTRCGICADGYSLDYTVTPTRMVDKRYGTTLPTKHARKIGRPCKRCFPRGDN